MISGQSSKFLIVFKGNFLLIIIFLLCSVPSTVYSGVTMCKELKPFNNIDELLYQFYVNFDSDCLFKIPVTDLEKVWEINLLDAERIAPDKYFDSKMSSMFAAKPYKSEKDAFYVEILQDRNNNSRSFRVIATKEYFNKHSTLFPDGKFPKLIPDPIKKISQKEIGPFEDSTSCGPKITGQYMMDLYMYYWLNSDQTRMMYLSGYRGIYEVVVINRVLPGFKKNSAD